MLRKAFLAIARLEGLSLLALFFFAMPLKYIWGHPEYVEWIGLAHGLLFVAYVGAMAFVARNEGWGMPQVGAGLIASVLPAGTFAFEYSLDGPMWSTPEDAQP